MKVVMFGRGVIATLHDGTVDLDVLDLVVLDLVVLGLAHYRLPGAARFQAPRIGAATALVFGNVWDEPLDARRRGIALPRSAAAVGELVAR